MSPPAEVIMRGRKNFKGSKAVKITPITYCQLFLTIILVVLQSSHESPWAKVMGQRTMANANAKSADVEVEGMVTS